MRLSRGGWALTAVAAGVVGLLLPDAPATAEDLTGDDFSSAFLALASLALLGVAAWILGIAALVATGGSSRLVRLLTPRLLSSALVAGTAGALVLSPAQAERGVAPPDHSVAGLQLPDRPSGASPATRPQQRDTAGRPPAGPVIVVRAGDTLWSIAARSLPGGATDAEIAAACARWHAANRAVIGDDPDLIFPHQRLTPPSGKDHP